MEHSQFQSQSISTLAKALIQVQRALQPAIKDSTNPFAKSKYASLNSVMEVCREPLIQNGIWLCQYPVPTKISPEYATLGLVTKLTHAESGEWQSSLTIIPLVKADPQAMGSALTYARRYALSAMLGIVTEDDDSNGSTVSNKAGPCTQRLNSAVDKVNSKKLNINAEQKSTMEMVDNRESPQMGAGSACPRVDGVSFEEHIDEHGQVIVVAVGNTLAKKSILSASGFKWNPREKHWYKAVS